MFTSFPCTSLSYREPSLRLRLRSTMPARFSRRCFDDISISLLGIPVNTESMELSSRPTMMGILSSVSCSCNLFSSFMRKSSDSNWSILLAVGTSNSSPSSVKRSITAIKYAAIALFCSSSLISEIPSMFFTTLKEALLEP